MQPIYPLTQKERERQVHNRSADSGKSSSPDTITSSASSSSGSSRMGASTNAMSKTTSVSNNLGNNISSSNNISNSNNNNNNYSGLNLNMTASQMRELIASRKKFDPKKVAMNIRQKYEIIQQM